MEIPEGSEQDFRDIIIPRGSMSAPPSACPSPIPKPSRTLGDYTLSCVCACDCDCVCACVCV